MPRLSALTNPTGLIDIDKGRVEIIFTENNGVATYSVARLDLENLSFPPNAQVVVVARRGNSEIRTEHGLVSNLDKGFIDISELSVDGSLKFRVLVVSPDMPKLLGSVENLRPNGLGNSESFIALEPAELGEVPWDLQILELEGRAVIRFNRAIYSSSAVAETDRHFSCLVYPEAVRQLACWHSQYVGALEDKCWSAFKSFLVFIGVTTEPQEEDSVDEKNKWCREVVSAFCERYHMASQLVTLVSIRGEE